MLQQALNTALALPAEDKGPDLSLVVLDGAMWKKLLISYDQLASSLTKTSLIPTFPTVIISSPMQFAVTSCATCMGPGGMEGTTPTSFGTDLKYHCSAGVKTRSIFRVCGIDIIPSMCKSFYNVEKYYWKMQQKVSISINFV